MLPYLTKVIIVAGFYSGCTGVVYGHRLYKEYYVHLKCHNGEITTEPSDWVNKRDLRKAAK